jgi:UDP-N-acetyl-D-mannosaminuronic acid dehydrogenase
MEGTLIISLPISNSEVRRRMIRLKVCVVGLGKIGFSTAEYVKNRGFEVFGYDIDPKAVKFSESKGIKAFEEWDKIPSDIDIFIICIYIGFEKGTLVRPDLSSLKDLCQKIMRKNKECLISIECTLPVGACRKMYKEVLSTKTLLVHVPHRWYEKEQEEHGVNQVRVFGAINAESRKHGLEFYQKRLSIPMHEVSSIELAELSKLVEQSFRYVQIAFAEEVKLVCDDKDLSFKELRDAVNTKWNIDMPDALEGIGGHCLPKDINFYLHFANFAPIIASASISADSLYKQKRREKNG